MAKKTAVLVANPITDAIDILNTDGWVKGEFRCEEGSRCAVGALRAAYGMFENDNRFVLKQGISNEQWADWMSHGEDLEVTTVIYDDESWDEDTQTHSEVLFDLAEMVEPIDPEQLTRYQEAVTVLADTLVPGWDIQATKDRDAYREALLAANYTLEQLDRIAPAVDPAHTRNNLEHAENAVIQFNDSRVNDEEGRDEVLAGFKKAAKKLGKARKAAVLA